MNDIELCRFSEQQGSATAPKADPLQRATAHLAFRMHCPLRLTEVAATVAFTSAGNLSRLFRQHHGLSFQAYLQKLRLNKAAELLRSTRLSIARIAKRVGYRDVSRFGQHFKRKFGGRLAHIASESNVRQSGRWFCDTELNYGFKLASFTGAGSAETRTEVLGDSPD